MEFKVILASVKSEITDHVVEAAKQAGATGATIVSGRGTGIHEAKSFFGLSLEAHTDLILFLLEASMTDPILKVVAEAGEFHKPGTGIAFVIPVDQVIGLESQIEAFE
jgi:nitrogen regulatory protein PII